MFITNLPNPKWHRFIEGWLHIAEGIVMVLTFGWVHAEWHSKWCRYMILYRCSK